MPPCRSDPHRRLSSCVQGQYTPLHNAVVNGDGDTCALLLEHKGDVNARTRITSSRARGEEGEGGRGGGCVCVCMYEYVCMMYDVCVSQGAYV